MMFTANWPRTQLTTGHYCDAQVDSAEAVAARVDRVI